MLQINQQPSELSIHENGSLQIVRTWLTIQGEGPFAGEPAVFVRLAGCNLQCPGCDTDYTTGRQVVSNHELLERVKLLRPAQVNPKILENRTLIVITGGEPFRQNFLPFAWAAIEAGYIVQVETNGTIFRDIHPVDPIIKNYGGVPEEVYPFIVCSPKGKVTHLMWDIIHSLKYVVRHGDVSEEDGLPIHTLQNKFGVSRPPGSWDGAIYIQPMDEQDEVRNKMNLDAAIQSCLKYGYTLCPQMHKIVGLD